VAQSVAYYEMRGALEPRVGPALRGDALVLSNIERGSAVSQPRKGLCIRYVGRGREDYRIGGRAYRLDAGQVMISTCDLATEVEVRPTEASGTFGLCALLAGEEEELPWVVGPLVAGVDCTSVGTAMHSCAGSFRTARHRDQLAAQLIAALRERIPALARTILTQAARIDAAKPATRYEMVRRVALAQACLHATLDRAVDLDELGRAVGTSPFQLLRGFQHCLGETPASYHRKLRLERALEEARRRRVTISQVADDFGFAGVSSFSHAYRRAFGHSPRHALS
jgi:AraC-like DNA-binding protein